MATKVLKMQQRSDTSTNWSTANPVLLEGEIGFEKDTKNIKIGDGVTAWQSLSYYSVGSSGGNIDLSNYIAKDNTTEYTPTTDYNPATKKYVDDGIINYINEAILGGAW